MRYDPTNWYWIINNDTTKVFSSGAGALIAATDRSYRMWIESGRLPSRILSASELFDVLEQAGVLGSNMNGLVAIGGLTPAQVYATKIAAGLECTSASTPALNGTYALNQQSQFNIMGVVTGIVAGKGFPGDAVTFDWPDLAGLSHTFPTTVLFLQFATALRDHISALNITLAQLEAGLTVTWPIASVPID